MTFVYLRCKYCKEKFVLRESYVERQMQTHCDTGHWLAQLYKETARLFVKIQWGAFVQPLLQWKCTVCPPRCRTRHFFNPLTPNYHYSGRTAPLTSKRCILYIFSTNIGTAYFKHGVYSPFFSLQNAVCFIILTYLVPVLFTFYIQVC